MSQEDLTPEEITDILSEYARLKYRMQRAKTQDYLTFCILMIIFAMTVFIVLASAFFSLDEIVIDIVKDIILLVCASFTSAVGFVYKFKEECNCVHR